MGDTPFTVELLRTDGPWMMETGRPGFWQYLNIVAHEEMAAAFATLFWPEFIEVEGCVLLREHYEAANFASWKDTLKGDRQQIEAMINHVHLCDLFLNNNPLGGSHPRVLAYLGQTLARSWPHALQETFPEKHFVVDYDEDPDWNYYGPEITFWQDR